MFIGFSATVFNFSSNKFCKRPLDIRSFKRLFDNYVPTKLFPRGYFIYRNAHTNRMSDFDFVAKIHKR